MENQEKDNRPEKSEQKVIGVLMMEAGVEFAFLIGVPLILGVLAGKWLDNRYNHNFFVIIGILLGLGLSCESIYIRIKDYKRILDNRSKK
jgi:undecaprenyl pyrophosphate phosphatase UppP